MKRYAATFDCYIYAENDEDAREQAHKMTVQMQKKGDNWAKCITLCETPYGTVDPREIDP